MFKQMMIVDKHFIDKVEESRKHLFKLAEQNWGLNEFQMIQLVNVTGDFWRIANRRWDECSHDHQVALRKLEIAKKALESIATGKCCDPLSDLYYDSSDAVIDLKDAAKDAIKEMGETE